RTSRCGTAAGSRLRSCADDNAAMDADAMPRGLYLLTPDEPDTARLLERVAPLLPFATWLQYRNKGAHAALRERQATALRMLCRDAGVPLLVNDDAALAARVSARSEEHTSELQSRENL